MADEQQEVDHVDVDEGAALEEGQPQLSDVELVAHEMGWRPKSEFDGPEGKWKPAKEYILGEREIRRGNKQEIKRLRETVDRLASAQNRATERALQRQAEELTRKFEESVKNQDTAGAAQAMKEMRQLEEEARPQTDDTDYVAQFTERNQWYGRNVKATALANHISAELGAQGMAKADQLAEIETRMREEMPELFGKAPERKATTTSAPSGRGVARKERGFSDLPPEVRRAAEAHAQLAKTRFGVDVDKSKADYARDYWSDQAA